MNGCMTVVDLATEICQRPALGGCLHETRTIPGAKRISARSADQDPRGTISDSSSLISIHRCLFSLTLLIVPMKKDSPTNVCV